MRETTYKLVQNNTQITITIFDPLSEEERQKKMEVACQKFLKAVIKEAKQKGINIDEYFVKEELDDESISTSEQSSI